MGLPFPQSDFSLEVAPDSSGSPGSFTSFAMEAISVQPGGGERSRGETYVAGRDYPHITASKRGPVNYTVRGMYTNTASEFWDVIRGYYLAKTYVWLRYSPEGGASGENLITVGRGLIISCPPPQGDAGSGDSMAFEFTFDAENESDSTAP